MKHFEQDRDKQVKSAKRAVDAARDGAFTGAVNVARYIQSQDFFGGSVQ